jgi:menaquinone-dependent protoporphyrinogen oxidase
LIRGCAVAEAVSSCFAYAMDEILIAYATKHGSTHEVAETIAARLAEAGAETHTLPVDRVGSIDGYAAVVLGAPLYMGRWHRDARAFLRRQRDALAKRPLAVFALGPVKDEPKQWDGAETQLYATLAHFPGIEPVSVALFGGAIVPDTLHFPFSHVPAGDLRDWAAIEEWAGRLPEALGLAVRVG